MYYRTCSICHSNLDPNEKCDCETKKETTPLPRQSSQTKVSTAILATEELKVKASRGCQDG